MRPPQVVVIGESQTLAENLAELLEGEEISVALVKSYEEAEAYCPPRAGVSQPVLVCVCGGRPSQSSGEWRAGGRHGSRMVVVGSRAIDQGADERLHYVRLPCEPEALLRLIRSLLPGPGETEEVPVAAPRHPSDPEPGAGGSVE